MTTRTSRSAAATLEHLAELRDELNRLREIDLEKFLSVARKGLALARRVGAEEFIAGFLISCAFQRKQVDDRAAGRALLDEAARHVEQVDGNAGMRLRMRHANILAELCQLDEDFEEARRHYLNGLAAARELADAGFQAHFHKQLAGLYTDLTADQASAVDHAREALRVVPDDEPILTTQILYALARLTYNAGDLASSRRYCDQMLTGDLRAAVDGLPNLLAVRLSMSAQVASDEGDLERAAKEATLAVDAARRYSHWDDSLRQALHVRGAVRLAHLDYHGAIADLEELVSLEQEEHRQVVNTCELAHALLLGATAGDVGGFGGADRPGPRPDRKGVAATGLPTVAERKRWRRRGITLLAEAEGRMEGLPPVLLCGCLELAAEAHYVLEDGMAAFALHRRAARVRNEMYDAKVRNDLGSMQLLMRIEREEHEREIQQMKAKQTERELSDATLQLLAQSQMLTELRSDLMRIVARIPSSQPGALELRDRLKRLPCESVDWHRFDLQFREVYPSFIRALLDRAPDLTTYEVRICSMVRMNLKSHEMAQILCTTEKGVEFHRTNIRRKLKMQREEKLPIVLGAL